MKYSLQVYETVVYYVKYWITVRQEIPDVKSFMVCGISLSTPYLVKMQLEGQQLDLLSYSRALDVILLKTDT